MQDPFFFQSLKPEQMYEQKIQETIYGVTGRNDTPDNVVKHVERAVHTYLTVVLSALREQHAARLSRKKGRKTLHIDDLYATLNGTPEMYGVQRCLLLKELKKSTENDPCVNVDSGVDSLQTRLIELDDGSDAFRQFNQTRLQDMIHADLLTRSMTSHEYLEYSKKGRTKFINQAKRFCEWLQWEPKPNDEILTAFAWLGPFRVKRLVNAALERDTTGTKELRLEYFVTSS